AAGWPVEPRIRRIQMPVCGDRVTTDTRGFITSLPPKAKLLLQAARRHWRGPSGCDTGSWTLPSARVTAASARATLPTI
ncbi:MAG: hypothetical protein OXH72_08740, partial [Caldilineaceae bacterium]|nr:hypothetical protein [Caldilineaceae bacterium]